MTYKECFAYGAEMLSKAGVPDAMIDARMLLEFICHTTRHDMILHGDKQVTEKQLQDYQDAVRKRSQRIPLQHITNEQSFMGFDFYVNEQVLIPRQDTEVLVETVLEYVSPKSYILDMCTGSGCILLSLLALGKSCQGMGADISEESLQVAKINQEKIAAQCGHTLQAEWITSDLFQQIKPQNQFDVIVSNPPYIASAVIDSLEPEVKLHEPLRALDGTENGLYFYEKIVAQSRSFLKDKAGLFFEIGYDQGEAVADLMRKAGFEGVTVRQDYAGLDRIVYGFLK